VWCSVLQCVAVCCSALQCVAVCCREFHHTHPKWRLRHMLSVQRGFRGVVVYYSLPQCDTVYFITHTRDETLRHMLSVQLGSRGVVVYHSVPQCETVYFITHTGDGRLVTDLASMAALSVL